MHFCVPCQCPWCTVAHRWWRSASGIAGVADAEREPPSLSFHLCFARGARGLARRSVAAPATPTLYLPTVIPFVGASAIACPRGGRALRAHAFFSPRLSVTSRLSEIGYRLSRASVIAPGRLSIFRLVHTGCVHRSKTCATPSPTVTRKSHAARARAGRHHEEGRDADAHGEGLQVGSFPLFAQRVRLVGARERLVKKRGADPQTQPCALTVAGVSTSVGPERLRHTSLVRRAARSQRGRPNVAGAASCGNSSSALSGCCACPYAAAEAGAEGGGGERA